MKVPEDESSTYGIGSWERKFSCTKVTWIAGAMPFWPVQWMQWK